MSHEQLRQIGGCELYYIDSGIVVVNEHDFEMLFEQSVNPKKREAVALDSFSIMTTCGKTSEEEDMIFVHYLRLTGSFRIQLRSI